MSDTKKPGWFSRLTQGLSKTSQQLTEQVTSVFVANKALDAAALEELEDMLIESDFGPQISATIAEKMASKKFAENDPTAVKEALAEAIADELRGREEGFDPLSGPKPNIVLFVGVNGSGKTTTLGKIAASLTARGAKVLIVAGDTFRAAAVEQLKVWAERAKADFMGRKTGADAAGLAYDACVRAKEEGYDVVLIDTAGRLQNKQQLMDELLKIVRVIKKVIDGAPHETLLVLDATVGRNALAQEQIFGRQAFVSGLVMTKLDGTARGGILVPIAKASDAPIKLIGVGEDIEDLQPFRAREFARSMVGLEPLSE
ncbi:signal recognition particle-docking protein FtsY [Asticcacaulis sp. BYS171W]|uniref:Signal recognition particle receptor FtsY n=1 Tax=Asticcacaulis aquaticus TaxID=2984212 RepID=A0ABT5HRP8_9CAUL|nr:signal recognition particle-docking protein FtsY [Asticcacaulis aquaticus]MDC7682659.1 signal recognition particle-docking protein FtsY [Asticcacaulis aquaticus]